MSQGGLKTAMILAAGFGKRLKPLTDSIPKALIPHNGKPMICNVINKLVNSGIEKIVINTHYFAGQVEEYFKNNKFDSEIILVHEQEILGTGGGIKNAEKYLRNESEFLVYNADIDCNIDLRHFYGTFLSKNPIAALAVKKRKSSRYLLADMEANLVGRTENGLDVVYKKTGAPHSVYAFCGIHILSTGIFEMLPLEKNFDMIPAYMNILQSEVSIVVYDIGDTYWNDLGKF